MYLNEEQISLIIKAIEWTLSEISHELDYYNPPQARRMELSNLKWELNKLEFIITNSK